LSTPPDGAVPVVATAGDLDPVVVLLRGLLHAASAVRATAVVPDPPGAPAVVDVARLLPVEVARGGEVVHLPHAAALNAVAPDLPEFAALPPFDVDPETGEVAAPLGAVEHRSRAVLAAAALLPTGGALQLVWETSREGVAFSVTARGRDEPIVLGVGDETFPMPAGWPDVPVDGPSSGAGERA
jgi:hypothetical protein